MLLPLVISSVLAAPPIEYDTLGLSGWHVKVERSLPVERPKLWAAVKQELTRQLQNIERVLPDAKLEKLRKVAFWVRFDDPKTPGAAFHPSAEWLREHELNPEMAGQIEIGNAQNFVTWTYDQPWMVMHELAHAYQAREMPKGEQNPEVLKAFDAAMRAKRYESVRHIDGRTLKAYATTNALEYFAEITEAYLGTNDMAPFVRVELEALDPDGFQLMKRTWGPPMRKLPHDP